jgi:hypothetical protein
MSRGAFPWLLAGGAAAAVVYFGTRRARDGADTPDRTIRRASMVPADAGVRNAGLTYRPIGASGEPYPPWVRALAGKSGVYILRETQRDGSTAIVYVGQSSTGRLYQTLTRHFQTWRRAKKFWSGQYTASQSHDPGLTYDRARIAVAVRIVPAARALAEEARLIARLRPRDNLLGQPVDDDQDDAVPF